MQHKERTKSPPREIFSAGKFNTFPIQNELFLKLLKFNNHSWKCQHKINNPIEWGRRNQLCNDDDSSTNNGKTRSRRQNTKSSHRCCNSYLGKARTFSPIASKMTIYIYRVRVRVLLSSEAGEDIFFGVELTRTSRLTGSPPGDPWIAHPLDARSTLKPQYVIPTVRSLPCLHCASYRTLCEPLHHTVPYTGTSTRDTTYAGLSTPIVHTHSPILQRLKVHSPPEMRNGRTVGGTIPQSKNDK